MNYNWQIKDPNEMIGGPSAWCFLNDSQIFNKTIILQKNDNFQSKSFLFGSQLLNKMKCFSPNYSYSLKIFITAPSVFSIIFDYVNEAYFDQLLFVKSSKNSELNHQKIRNGKLIEKHTKNVCEQRENSKSSQEDCIPLDFHEVHGIYLLSYQGEVIIKINDNSVANYQRDHFIENETFSFGIGSFTEGSKVYFTDIEYSMINFPQKAKNTIFGSGPKPKSQEIFNNRKPSMNEEKNFLGFRFKEEVKNKEKTTFEEEDSRDNKRLGEDLSIELIKLTCMKYQGSEESCTQAMIAYDELVSRRKRQDIEEEEISRVVYKKCLDFEGNSPLGCSFAYKKALEVRKIRRILKINFFSYRFTENRRMTQLFNEKKEKKVKKIKIVKK